MATVGDVHVTLTGDATKLNTAMDKAQGSMGRVKSAVGGVMKVLGPLTAMIGGGVLAKGFYDINARSQTLMMSLKTVTGSVENATKAFEGIVEFTAKTPFQIEEVAGAFVKLKAFGLDPSARALTAYGNTASAMGKSMDDMIEAVADAATGEMERLKEFGIRASQQGDQVTFTFQGVTTTVKKNAEEIQEYLLGIGETNFAGAMDDQMDTLSGTMSNLMDNVGNLARAIGEEGGVNDAMKNAIGVVRDLFGKMAESTDTIKRVIGNIQYLTRVTALSTAAFYAGRAAMVAYTAAQFMVSGATTGLATATGLLTTAMRVLLGSTGIGLLAVAAGVLIEWLKPWEYFLGTKSKVDDLTDSVENFTGVIGDAGDELNKANYATAIQDAVDVVKELEEKAAYAEKNIYMLGRANFNELNDELIEARGYLEDLRKESEELFPEPTGATAFQVAISDLVVTLPTYTEALRDMAAAKAAVAGIGIDPNQAEIISQLSEEGIARHKLREQRRMEAEELAGFNKRMADYRQEMEDSRTTTEKFFETTFGRTMMHGFQHFAVNAAFAAVKLEDWASATEAAVTALKQLAAELIRLAAQKVLTSVIRMLFDTRSEDSGGGGSGNMGRKGGKTGKSWWNIFGDVGRAVKDWGPAVAAIGSGLVSAGAEGVQVLEIGSQLAKPRGGPGPPLATRPAAAGGISLTVNVAGSVGVDDIGEELIKKLRGHGLR